jgi:dTDP-4-dehydrorhamnose reductase
MKTILITGGNGGLAQEITKQAIGYKVMSPNKIDLDIVQSDSIERYLIDKNIDYLIHAAALTKPMSIHDEDIIKSIDTNIIGTANIVKYCKKHNIKLIHISTDYVYPAGSTDIDEKEGLLPFNNYGWSKLGAESAVQMYDNSLILRLSFLPKPFPFTKGAVNIFRNVGYIDETAKNILYVLDEVGTLNIGRGKVSSMYHLGLETNMEVKPLMVGYKLGKEKSITLNVNKFIKIKKK